MFRQHFLSLCVFLLSSMVPLRSAAQQSKIPNAILEIAVRQKEADKIEKGVHLLKLYCWDGSCSLTSLSLNQCRERGDGSQAFFPKIQRTSTVEGNLKVWAEKNVLVTQETGFDISGDYVTTLRLGFEAPASGSPAMKVTNFTGGFVKNSSILQKVITVDYIPLRGRTQSVHLDCEVLLPGLATE